MTEKEKQIIYQAAKNTFNSWPKWKQKAALEFMNAHKEEKEEPNDTCKKCENWKYERLWIGYKFCPYCGRVLDI